MIQVFDGSGEQARADGDLRLYPLDNQRCQRDGWFYLHFSGMRADNSLIVTLYAPATGDRASYECGVGTYRNEAEAVRARDLCNAALASRG